MITFAICEDNPIHAEKTREIIKETITGSYHIDLFSSGEAFEKKLETMTFPYAIVFMDIDLGDTSGIELTGKLNQRFPSSQVIYISQYLKYAADVYETSHVYFIDKEREDDYLKKAIHKAMSLFEESQKRSLIFRRQQRSYCIPQDSILYMERVLRLTHIYTTGDSYETTEKLPSILGRLSPDFALCHRSFLVNFKVVQSLSREELTLHNGTLIPIGRTYYEDAKRAFARVISQSSL